jgi:hypothetical protein
MVSIATTAAVERYPARRQRGRGIDGTLPARDPYADASGIGAAVVIRDRSMASVCCSGPERSSA